MEAGFAVGNRHDVIVDLALFEVGIDTLEFDIGGTIFRTATILENPFQTDASVARCSDSAFTPLLCCQYFIQRAEVRERREHL